MILNISNGYEKFLFHPILSLFSSLLLFFGISFLGYLILKFTFLKKLKKNDYYYFISPLVSLNLLIIIIFPLINLNIFSGKYFYFFSYLTLFLGFLGIVYSYQKKKIIINFIKSIDKKIKLILLLFFILCLTPVTDADSLAYHLDVATDLLIYGNYDKNILPFETKQAGAGEILITIGLAAGSEYFSKLVQFSSLIAILGIFKNTNFKNPNSEKINNLILLSIFISPLTLLFASSAKPQFMQCVNCLMVFSIIYQNLFNLKYDEKKILIILLIFILTINFVSKFSFLLSSGILGLYLLHYCYKNNYLKYFLLGSFLSVTIIVFPSFMFKKINFGIGLFDFFQSPLPINIYAFEKLTEALKNVGFTPKYLPIWIIFPLNDFRDVSNVIGPVFLIFLFFDKTRKIITYLLAVLSFIVLVIFLGQSTPRFFFEAFLIIVFLMLSIKLKKKLNFIFKFFINAQYYSIIILLVYFISILFPFHMTNYGRKHIMLQNANGYELINWINNKIQKDEYILFHHRSKSLLNATGYETFFLKSLDFNKKENIEIKNLIKKNKVKKLVYFTNNDKVFFKECITSILHYKEKAGKKVGRNPFRKKKQFYDAWIYEFDYEKFPNC